MRMTFLSSGKQKITYKKSAGEIKTVCNVRIYANKFLINNATSDRQKKSFLCLAVCLFFFCEHSNWCPSYTNLGNAQSHVSRKKFLERSEKAFFLKEHKGNLVPHSWLAQ